MTLLPLDRGEVAGQSYLEILWESCDTQSQAKLEHKGEDAKASLILPDLAENRLARGASGIALDWHSDNPDRRAAVPFRFGERSYAARVATTSRCPRT